MDELYDAKKDQVPKTFHSWYVYFVYCVLRFNINSIMGQGFRKVYLTKRKKFSDGRRNSPLDEKNSDLEINSATNEIFQMKNLKCVNF